MKNGLIATTLVALTLSTSPLWAQQPQHEKRNLAPERQQLRENRGGNEIITAQYNLILKEIKLTNDQKKKLKKEFDLLQQDSQSFREDSREQLRDQSDDDRKKIIQKLNAQWEKILGDHQASINTILTPEQRETWQDIRLSNAIRLRLYSVEFTTEQDDQLKKMINAAAKDIAKIDGHDVKALTEAQGKLLKGILTEVLTDEQLSRYMLASPAPISFGWGRFGGDWGGGGFGPGGPVQGGEGQR